MEPQSLASMLEQYLADARDAVVMEDGAVTFELARARYAVSAERGKCVLHLWSDERNVVRRVVEAEEKSGVLRLAVLRFGQAHASRLEICRDRDRRSGSARKSSRVTYQQRLRRVLSRQFPEFTIAQMTSAMDLERSFGPVYARGMLRRGRSAFAFLGVNADETQSSTDASLTFAILWLNACREASPTLQVEGVKVFVPAGRSSVVRERMAHLDCAAAKWQLFELNEREENLVQLDTGDRGNLATRLVHCSDEAAARQRFTESVERIQAICPEAEAATISAAEIAFRLRGLEFARARLAADGFRSRQEIVFGVAGGETTLREDNAEQFEGIVKRVAGIRRLDGPRDHTLWRMHPERWLESLVARDIARVDGSLRTSPVYSQVPAFSASDRAMIDLLAATCEGHLAVVELKADEDIHLPLQGVDYWARVQSHHARGEFARFGYFPGIELAAAAPWLILVAPALHIHPATDTLLRYLSPEIDWMVAGIDEHWRERVRVVFRKRGKAAACAVA